MDLVFSQLGLTENEAKVYLAVLNQGPAAVSAISLQTGIKRPTVYFSLENLSKLGLVSEVPKGKIKLFKAEKAERLNSLMKKQRRQMIAAELQLEQLLPGLKALEDKIVEAPTVTFYQGMGGILSILEDVVQCNEPWYYFGSSEEIVKSITSKEFIDFMKGAAQLRETAGRPDVTVITDEGVKQAKGLWNEDPKLRKIKIMPGLAKAKSGFFIYSNKLGVISVKGAIFGAIIESQEVATLEKMMFKIIWDSLAEEKAKK